jgi:long-chain fatty acid transport protein
MFACIYYGRRRANLSKTGSLTFSAELAFTPAPTMTLVAADVSPLHLFKQFQSRLTPAAAVQGFKTRQNVSGSSHVMADALPATTTPMQVPGFVRRPGFACPGAASMRIYGVHSVVGTHESVMINRRNTLRLLALMVSGALAMKASANGFGLADQDAFATARGEAFVATADNPSAIYYNPAGLTQLEGCDLRGGIYGIYYDPSYHTNHGNTYHSSDNLAAIPQFFFAYSPTNLPVSFGLGVYSPYGGSMNWPQDTGFRAVALNSSLTYLTINPVVAYKVLPSLSLGAGLMVNYANMDLESGILRDQLPYTNFFRFNGNGWSVGYNLGVRWQPIDQISIGATFRSSATVTLDGQTTIQQYPVTPTPKTRSAQTGFEFPLTAVFGISYRPTPKWNLEFDADYTDWSSFGSNSIHQATKPPGINQNIPVTLYWQPSWMYEFGVTRYFDNGWHASAGCVYNENSVPNANYTPFAADLDRYFFSVGAGHKGKRFDFDIAYQFGYGPTHTVTGSKPSTAGHIAGQTADGNYDFISSAVFVSAGWHF